MRSIVLVGACLASAGHAHRMHATNLKQQVKHTAQRIAEDGEMPHVKKLAMLLLASNSMSSGTYSHTWALGDEKGRALSRPIAGTHSQAEEEFLQKEKLAEAQDQPEFDNSWGLGDERGRTFAAPIAGTHSQTEVEFEQKQKRRAGFSGLGGIFARRGGAQSEEVQAAPINNAWAFGTENGRTPEAPILGTHSQAEEEFLQKEKIAKSQEPPKFNNSWGLGDERGRFFAAPIAGTHSQAEEEFLQKEKIAKAQEPAQFDNSWGLGDEKGRKFGEPIAGTHSQTEEEFKQKQDKWHRR